MDETRTESGFSLIELLVAMLVTMIVSGAIFTLLNAGQGAFRREPELTDRQQNIRLAMDMIQRDIATAGAGMDPFEQSFSAGDAPGEGGAQLDGMSGTMGGFVGPSGLPPDVLEVKGADGSCADVPVGAPGPPITTPFNLPPCFPGVPQPPPAPPAVGLVAVTFDTGAADTAAWGMTGPNPGGTLVFGAQPAKTELPGGVLPAGTPTRVMPIQMARYAIALDPAGVPNLWRSGRGGLDVAGALTLPGNPAGNWQLLARGIEDLQVRYRHGDDLVFAAGCCGSPRVAVPANFTTIVKEVEVTLWARTLAPNLQGQTTGPMANTNAIRGSLVTVTTPRSALQALTDPAAGALRWQ